MRPSLNRISRRPRSPSPIRVCYEFELAVTDGGGLTDTDLVRIQAIDSTGPFTWSERSPSGADDVEEDASTGKVVLTNNDLDLVLDTTTNKLVGLRFTNVSIPANAVIQSAYLQFRSDEIQSGATSLTIQGFATSNLTAFTTTRYGIGTRPRTTSVAWDPVPSWTATGRSGPEQRTPNLAGIVQQIIDLPGGHPTMPSVSSLPVPAREPPTSRRRLRHPAWSSPIRFGVMIDLPHCCCRPSPAWNSQAIARAAHVGRRTNISENPLNKFPPKVSCGSERGNVVVRGQ